MQPLITVIIPVFNKIEVIEACIEYNIAGADLKCEWLIIDNASDQATVEGLQRLKHYAESLGHTCRIMTETENTGVAKAWNKGLNNASGVYCCILNNDAIMTLNWCSSLINALKYQPLDFCSPFLIEPHLMQVDISPELFKTADFQEQIVGLNEHTYRPGYFGGVIFFGRTADFLAVKGFDEGFWLSLEDIDFLLRAEQMGFRLGITGKAAAWHYVSATRRGINLNEKPNQALFLQKHGWHFEKAEVTFINKMIKSANKLALRYFNKLYPFALQYQKADKTS